MTNQPGAEVLAKGPRETAEKDLFPGHPHPTAWLQRALFGGVGIRAVFGPTVTGGCRIGWQRNTRRARVTTETASPVGGFSASFAEDVSAADHEPQPGGRNIAWLDEMIRSLPDGYRQAVQMAEIEEHSQQDVADRLGLSLSGAKSRIQRGRAMLKDALQRCCSFELDVRGRVMGCDPKPDQQVCRDCGE